MPSQEEYKQMRGITLNNKNPILEVLQNNLGEFSNAKFVDNYYYSSELMGLAGNYLYLYNILTGSEGSKLYSNQCDQIYPYKAVCAFKLKK